jgi:hypothetical protein
LTSLGDIRIDFIFFLEIGLRVNRMIFEMSIEVNTQALSFWERDVGCVSGE